VALEDSRVASCNERLDSIERASSAATDAAASRLAVAERSVNAVLEEQRQVCVCRHNPHA
jgi:hypothetical protein